MSPRCMLSVLFSHVWRGKALSLIVFLITLLVPLAAQANDNPYKSSEVCVRVAQNAVVIDGKTYAKININKEKEIEDPRACSLRTAYAAFPILDQSGKQLGIDAWLRSVYATNQGSHPTVLRGCVPTANHKPPASATDEEKAFCPRGVVHIFDVPSNGWTAWILIPRQPVSTWAEVQATAAKVACAGATTPEAKKACQDAGYQPSTSSTQTPALVTADAAKFSKELEAKIAELQKKLAESEKTLSETKEQLATTERSNFQLSLYGFLISIAFIIEVIRNWRLNKKLKVSEKNLKDARDELQKVQDDLQKARKSQKTEPPNVATLRTQLKEADDSNKKLVAQHAQANAQWQAELAEANRQKDEAVTQREEAKANLQKANTEITGLREELGRKNREVQYNERRVIQLAGESGGFHFRANELAANSNELQAKNIKLAAQVAEKEETIVALRSYIEELQKQLKAANDNAAQATTPTTVTPTPPTTVTTPPTTVTEQPSTTLRGFPAVTPPADQGQQQSVRQCLIQNESDVFRNGMPEIVFLLGGDPQVLVDAEPEAIMIRAIELASDNNAKVVELESQLMSVCGLRGTAERQVAAHERAIGQLSEQLEREGQAKAQAIARETVLQQVADGFEDKATEPEKKVLEALFKAARLESEVMTLRFSVHRAETKQQVAERERDQATGAFYQLRLLYTLSQVTLQKAVSGSDCVDAPRQPSDTAALRRFLTQGLNAPRTPTMPPGDDPEIETRESWNGPEPVTVPRRATVSPQVEQSAVVLKDQLGQNQSGSSAATPYIGFPPSPHHKTIPIPAQPEPKPDKSGQGNG